MADGNFVDFDRMTGEPIDNLASAHQSVVTIFSTRLESMPMLREFGAGEIELLGRSFRPALFALWKQTAGTAIDIWEPRFRVRRVLFSGTVDELRLGHAGLDLEMDYRPNGHLGDFRVERVVNMTLYFVGGSVTAAS